MAQHNNSSSRSQLPYYAPPLGEGIKRWCASDVSRIYRGPKSITERPRKTKIGTEVAHITRDSDHFQGQKVKGQGHQADLVGCSSHHIRQQFICHHPESPLARGMGIFCRPPTQLVKLKLCNLTTCISGKTGVPGENWGSQPRPPSQLRTAPA